MAIVSRAYGLDNCRFFSRLKTRSGENMSKMRFPTLSKLFKGRFGGPPAIYAKLIVLVLPQMVMVNRLPILEFLLKFLELWGIGDLDTSLQISYPDV